MEIFNLLEEIKNKRLKKKLLSLWASLENRFREMPASVKFHHNYRGGLYDHTKEVIQIALQLYDAFKNNFVANGVSQDDVILISFSHDLDKINKYIKNKKRFGYNYHEFVWNDSRIDTNDTAEVVNILGQYGINLDGNQLNALSFSHGGWSVDRGKMGTLATLIHCADILSLALEEKKKNVSL